MRRKCAHNPGASLRFGAQTQDIPFAMAVTFEKTTLPNGLTILSETDPDAHTSAAGFFVRTGSRDETSDLMGVSHFLEHMMFKGTDRRSADDINREFDEIGARYNAWTSSEMTCFYAQVLPEQMGPAIDLLGDMMRPALRDDDFNTERGVILEEIAMYKDNPFWVLYDHALGKRYPGHPLGHMVLGTSETITALPVQAMRDYFAARYSADNTVVALAGKIDFDRVVADVERLCGQWKNTGATRDETEPQAPEATFLERDEGLNRAYILSLSPAPAMQDMRRYAAMLLGKALGDPDNSLVHWAVIDNGLADEAQISYEPHDGGGNWFIYASCSPDRVEDVQARIDEQIATALDQITDRDLERLRNKAATGVTVAGERPGGRMQRLGRLWTYLGEHLTLEEELERLTSVTLDDLRAVYEAYPFAPRTTGVLRP
jgi:predicted Zn-dependent peptidase